MYGIGRVLLLLTPYHRPHLQLTDLYDEAGVDLPDLLLWRFLHGNEGYGHEGMSVYGPVDLLLGSPGPHRRLDLCSQPLLGVRDDLKAPSLFVEEQWLGESLGRKVDFKKSIVYFLIIS